MEINEIIVPMQKSHQDGIDDLLWVAPPDNFGGKSMRLAQSKSQWKKEFSGYGDYLHGLVEGFLDGNVEVIVLPNKFAAVCYHMSMPEQYDVSLPLGFIATDSEMVSKVTKLVNSYIGGMQGYDKPNDLGLIIN